MNALYLVDGYGLIYRAYFAFARTPMKNLQGQNNAAVFGFFRILLSLYKHYKPEQLAVILDPIGPTFRDEMYPEYKANRDKTPEDLKLQFPVIDEIIAALKMPVVRVEGFEADDVIATIATRCRQSGQTCKIISADKDLMQLVEGSVTMLRPSREGGFEELDAAGVFAEKGVRPDQIVDYLSLLGDSSDNVPGVAGIGEKTAVKLLADFGTLENLYANVASAGSPSIQGKLTTGHESALLSKSLVQLRQDVPLPGGDDYLVPPCTGIDGQAGAALLRTQGIKQLADDYVTVFNGSGAGIFELEAIPAKPVANVEPAMPLTDKLPAVQCYDAATQHYELVRDAASLKQLCRDLQTAGTLVFDTETNGLDPHTATLCGISFCREEGRAWYAAFMGPDGPVISLDEVRSDLAALFANPAVLLVAQNARFDWQILAANGMRPHGIHFDTMIAAWMVDSTRNQYGMDDLSREYLAYEPIHFDDLFSKEDRQLGKKDATYMHFSRVPLEQAAVYSAEDADVTYRLFVHLQARITAMNLVTVFHEQEMALIPIVADMEYLGMGLDSMELAAYSQELEVRMHATEQEIYKLVGHPFNINSTKQLQEVLFVERKLSPSRKTKTGFSTDVSVLEELAHEDVVPRKILDFRSLTKLKSTYADALPALVNRRTGRLHTSFVQTGTATGRLSSRDPNLQNIPIKDDDGRRIRAAFVPAPGKLFVSADYSQIELVVMAHLADDPGLKRAFVEGIDVHTLTASLLFGIATDEVKPEQRRVAKTINFGVLYGMSAFRLSNELGVPNRQAQGFIDAYFTSYPGIRGFVDQQVAICARDGGVRTMTGRFRPIPAIHSSNRNERQAAERIAVNTPIQGTAADIVKRAMLRVHAALLEQKLAARLVLQVHDELILELPEAELEPVMALCRQEMPRAMDLSVPLRVSVEWGRRWGDMH